MSALKEYLGQFAKKPEAEPIRSASPYACRAHGCPLGGAFAEGGQGAPHSCCWVHDGAPYEKWPAVTDAIHGMSRWLRLYDLLASQEGRERAGVEWEPEKLAALAGKAASELGDPRLALQESDFLTRRWIKGQKDPQECHIPSWYRYIGRLRKMIRERVGAQ